MPIDYGKLRNITAREIISALSRDGFHIRSRKGSHQRYHHPDGRKVTVSFHGTDDTFPPKTLKSMVEKQAKWTDRDLKRLKILK
ncbi:MAG: type II toxin-antitoxin system HicA family toxin [Euryarchaeota archaeon]|nr:type II toxin-antitoxin system HicA family toxin [Euryarchaeota archaeon]